jgi:hypothetical protein
VKTQGRKLRGVRRGDWACLVYGELASRGWRGEGRVAPCCPRWCLTRLEGFDDDHGPAAAGARLGEVVFGVIALAVGFSPLAKSRLAARWGRHLPQSPVQDCRLSQARRLEAQPAGRPAPSDAAALPSKDHWLSTRRAVIITTLGGRWGNHCETCWRLVGADRSWQIR